jgi:hypothetical protein
VDLEGGPRSGGGGGGGTADNDRGDDEEDAADDGKEVAKVGTKSFGVCVEVGGRTVE